MFNKHLLFAVVLFGITFGAGQAIRKLDPIAFDVMYTEQLDTMERDRNYAD